MTPSIYSFIEALRDAPNAFSTIGTMEVERDEWGEVKPMRTAMFSEVRITLRGAKYLLCVPITDRSIRQVERIAASLKLVSSRYISQYVVLRGEMSYRDGLGREMLSDVLLHALPSGEELACVAPFVGAEHLCRAIDLMGEELHRIGMSHNNLKPSNVILGEDGRLYPIRYHYAQISSAPDNSAGLDVLRRFVAEHSSVGSYGVADSADVLNDDSEPYNAAAAEGFDGHLWVGEPFEECRCVQDASGYGYVDAQNRYLLEPRYKWAADFREGRAEVQTAEGSMGLINKRGEYIIEPRYDIVEYDEHTGTSIVVSGAQRALFDYNGAQLDAFK